MYTFESLPRRKEFKLSRDINELYFGPRERPTWLEIDNTFRGRSYARKCYRAVPTRTDYRSPPVGLA